MTLKILPLVLSLLCACASDFNPTVAENSSFQPDPSADSADEDPSESDESSDDGAGTTGDSDDGTTSGDAEDSSSGETTAEMPVENPGPGEPCNPFDAFEGEAPCDGDPTTPTVLYSCLPSMTGSLSEDPAWEFRCAPVVDLQGDGEEIGDPCSDDGGTMFAGCMNSLCLSNGLSNDPQQDSYQNHPPIPSDDACPFVWWSPDDPNHESGYYVKACCSNFCDDSHPCDAGWTCLTNQGHVPATLDGKAVGACVWQ